MAFATVDQLAGDDRKFTVSPEIKQFTLLDMGFKKLNNGSFVLKQPLSGVNPAIGFTLKVGISKDLKQLKLVVTDAKGLRKVNLFDDKHPEDVEQLNFQIQNLILRKVLAITN
ncbi:cysteine desulfurase [Lactobacillus sp. Sy-1]|uniref:cysteine desulfurase n=1 Tax=Lactobacillus sp. Sy-1 TaxID=2109645 RepID=UPI001C5A5339|nr:cysteine desulfurase [Lactobacillus sp. Sy-1]MBW1605426.1 cysteine desulfurase [Lactobacillus sp. Sy-1]